MKEYNIYRGTGGFALVFCLCAFAASSGWAMVVTWSFNPSNSEGPTGSTSASFTSDGYNLEASGYAVGATNTPLGLYYKTAGADLPGLGVVSTSDHQLQGNGWLTTSFIQLAVGSLVSQGFTDGKIQIGNVYNSETFVIFGSSSLGDLGQQIGGVYGSSSNLSFISLADFANYDYISIGAINGGVLPVSFQATLTPIPELGALFPIVGLVVAVAITEILRRRRAAHLRSGPPGTS